MTTWPNLACALVIPIQKTRPPAAVSVQSMITSLGSQRMSLILAWRQLSVKLGAAQSQLLQARDEDQYAMYRTTAARCKPVTKHLAVQTFVWYWLVSVLAEDVKFPSWLVTCLLCTQGLRRSADFNTINVSCPAFHIFLCSFCSDAL